MLRALLLAPPGAGKGTQGDRIASIYGVRHISTGELLRAQVANATAIGQQVKAAVERGDLVSDRLVLELVLEEIARPESGDGFVLDGFPRTMTQARLAYEWAVANHRTFHAVIHLEVPFDDLVTRLLRRAQVESRTDDTVETVRRRLAIYAENAEPMIEWYRSRHILVEIDGVGPVDEVTRRIRGRLDELDLDE
ncbi:MAG TPA: adenylate kinase [Acidimicrobiales bacterium]|nr:adenylate kinase [Acidimicrobiales bacterium]